MPDALTLFGLGGVGFGLVLMVVAFTRAGSGRHIPRLDPTETFIFGLLVLALAGVAYRSPQFFGAPMAEKIGFRLMIAGLCLLGISLLQQVWHRRRRHKITSRRVHYR